MMAAPTPAPTAWRGGGGAAVASRCRRVGKRPLAALLAALATRAAPAWGRQVGKRPLATGGRARSSQPPKLDPVAVHRLPLEIRRRWTPVAPLPPPLSAPRAAAKGAGNARRGAPCRAVALPRTRHGRQPLRPAAVPAASPTTPAAKTAALEDRRKLLVAGPVPRRAADYGRLLIRPCAFK